MIIFGDSFFDVYCTSWAGLTDILRMLATEFVYESLHAFACYSQGMIFKSQFISTKTT